MSLEQICGYRCLINDVEKLRKQSYCSEDTHHEETLMKVCMFK